MSVMAMGFRLRQAGWSYATTMKDLSNAFGSTNWTALDAVVNEHSAPEDRVLCRQRYRLSVVEVDTTTGPLLMKTGCGGVMGDPFNVQGFAGAFVKPVQDWAHSVFEAIPTTQLLTTLWCGVKLDMSYQKYADDLLRIIPLCVGEGMEDVFDTLNKVDDLLDASLDTTGYVQNKQKQVTQFYIAGSGSALCKKYIRSQGIEGGRIAGTVSDVARYLGPMITPLQLASPELERRMNAASAGFYSMGAFWSMESPKAWKR
eukprot:2258773-Pyramimonas_sp.AAC.1